MFTDKHCADIYFKYRDGQLSYAEAASQMGKHGDRLLGDMLMNGFTTNFQVNTKDWVGMTGSSSI